jgi:CDP-diacylglycerol--serine O-phosphatidyltransferase
MRKRVFLIPSVVTAFGLACGLFVIFRLAMGETGASKEQLIYTSLVLLLVAAFADLIDGALARILRAESEFGFIFDSLADAISFGVAPSVLLLRNLSLEYGSGLAFFAIMGAMLYSICGVLRLVRFNVRTVAARGDREEMAAQKRNFTGLPIPAAAITAVATNLFFASSYRHHIPLGDEAGMMLLTGMMIMLAFLMVSRWKFPSLKALHVRVPSFYLVLVTVVVASFLLYGILHFFPLLILGLSWGYIGIGCILSIIRMIAGKTSKTLEDFEPDEEEEE